MNCEKEKDFLSYPSLAHGFWHVTSPIGFYMIIEEGFIHPNTGQFPFSFPQSRNSYGFKRGYISIFDFDTPTDEQCKETSDRWIHFFYRHSPWTIALKLDRESLQRGFVPNSKASQEKAYRDIWIPQVEAWYDGCIPIGSIERYMVIDPNKTQKPYFIVINGLLHKQFIQSLRDRMLE